MSHVNKFQFNPGPPANNPANSQNNNRMDGYTYDAAGNLLNDKTHNYFYDAENRIIQVDGTLGNCSTATACYVYDAFGRRVGRTGYMDTTCEANHQAEYLYDLSDHAISELDSNYLACESEIYVGARHLGSVRGGAIFSHTDWVGTERVRIGYASVANRNYDQHCTSLPFGDGMSPCDGTYSSPLHFTGKERDPETGLDNFGARYNASSMGRFTRPDPIMFSKQKLVDPQQWNMYSYARNNPLRFTDPTGMYVCKDSAKCDSENDIAFQARLNALKTARDTYKPDSKEYKKIDKILSEYGGAGEKGTANGKTVQVDFTNKGDGGRTQEISKATIGVNFSTNFAETAEKNPVGTAVLVGHEGSHVVDDALGGRSRFGKEWGAESVSQDIAQGLGFWKFTVRGVEILDRDRMTDGSQRGGWLRTTRAFDAAVKDFQEDLKDADQ